MGISEIPDVNFFLFGMANRAKLIYKKSVLSNSLTGEIVNEWNIKQETIIPNEYRVNLLAVDNITVGPGCIIDGYVF